MPDSKSILAKDLVQEMTNSKATETKQITLKCDPATTLGGTMGN